MNKFFSFIGVAVMGALTAVFTQVVTNRQIYEDVNNIIDEKFIEIASACEESNESERKN